MKKIKFEYKITFIYLAFGILWIIFSDLFLEALVQDKNTLSDIQSIKGIFFVLVTALFLFILVKNHTKRQRVNEQKISESNTRYKALYENAPLAFQSLDEDGNFIDINPEWVNLLGYKREEVIGKWFGDFLAPEHVEPFKARFKDFKRKGAVSNAQFKMRKKDGGFIYVAYEGTIGKNLDGSFKNTFCTFKNNTEEFIAKQNLLESEKRYKALFHENKSIMLLVDGNTGNLIDANDSALTFYGYSIDEIKKLNISKINSLPVEKAKQAIKSVISEKRHYFQAKHTLKNGEVRDVEMYCGKIIIQDKPYIYSIIHDITAQKLTEQELIKAKEKAEESDRLKSAFLANLSHEIRTPMNGIMGFTELLRNPDLTSDRKNEYIRMVHNSGNYLLSIINDIVEVAHLETNQVTVNVENVNINSLFNEAYVELNVSIPIEKRIELVIDKTLPKEHAFIETDGVKLKQILVNLLSNSIKYTESGDIKFGCELLDENVLIFHVVDPGIGISKEHQEIIFERFRQANDVGTNFKDGFGLGLSITKSYVELLGGEIWVESEPGKGASFFFTIPLKYAEREIKEPAILKEVNKAHAERKMTILVVEDDEINFKYLYELLSGANKQILHARNGQEAVDICRENDFIDLVLMDIKMPVMDGNEALKHIKKIRADLKIVAQTAYALKYDEAQLLAKGFDGYLAKPINKDKLLNLIQSLN